MKLMGCEHLGDAVGGWGVWAMANTYTHSVPRDTQGGWSLGQ